MRGVRWETDAAERTARQTDVVQQLAKLAPAFDEFADDFKRFGVFFHAAWMCWFVVTIYTTLVSRDWSSEQRPKHVGLETD